MLQLKKISKSFDNKKVLDEIFLEINRAEIVGLVGESGCGKTTLAKIIVGLERPDSGEISFCEKEKKKVQMIFQNVHGSFNPKFRLKSSLAEARTGKSRKELLEESLEESLESVGLEKLFLNRFPHELSGGQIQRMSIARALLSKPELLLADEPTSALDIFNKLQILHLLRSLKEKIGLSCLVITHDILSLASLADKIYVMQSGRIVESGKTTDVLKNPENSYTKKLINSVPKFIY